MTPWIISSVVIVVAVLGYFFIPLGSALPQSGDDDWGSAA